jgi:hypothetical protein
MCVVLWAGSGVCLVSLHWFKGRCLGEKTIPIGNLFLCLPIVDMPGFVLLLLCSDPSVGPMVICFIVHSSLFNKNFLTNMVFSGDI